MKVTPLAIPDVLLIEPKVFGDDRGFFLESFHAKRYADVGVVGPFVQDNLSRSVKGTLRGLHFQEPNAQGKLVQCLAGAVWDVAVDIRKGSPTFGRWVAAELTGENKHQLWVPAGLAHGFCVVSDSADFFYKCTALYSPESEQSVAWDDPDLAIPWPVKQPLLSAKDQRAPRLKDAPVLPVF
ncbi:dTDP-4-dehydrorhamnose 3,5-epimerase [Corallococcus sp. AB030]|uniref:dTDP-4-dehydrorhamnose 3,5-epimerase n=1 Tax=Corallococcus exiguus TaxID=83462 RepID=A0A7X4Y8Q7_9BACT|nr:MULTISPECIES: dTDP-4-dehydrorhamnose 3,5-epimerase [Corallococcus]NBC39877.1 dTDP-4-dehydrorhamnose 3,5-epimerase [Corallococcus exiguus]NNB84928.1 dTDP-4-dehydrorhamnose 3,5-epimerase [Corallococcus exiguus]NPC46829.1 dTDP-4-dehydrorhamnose 3,5-epimerase [Corallococcus exiguus]NPD25455.1 dTDP-4-dehydrorhamnose 3,5-epimerase [Corallococcus exiguus]RKH78326.1 dTDP-4-dehydrorhamnose 3,5-epimerase [Corallococcus sp. AB032C]